MGFLGAIDMPRRLALAGGVYPGRELRLRDLAALEALCADALGDPLAPLVGSDADDPATYRARLRAAHAAAEEAAEIPAARVRAWVRAAPAGRAYFLGMVLRDAGLSAAETLDLAGLLTAEEWDRVERLAYGVDPLAEVWQLILDELGIELPWGDADRRGTPWRKAMAELCHLLRKTPAEVGAMTIGEANNVRTGGSRPKQGIEQPRGWSEERFDAEIGDRLAAFWEEDANDAPGPAQAPGA